LSDIMSAASSTTLFPDATLLSAIIETQTDITSELRVERVTNVIAERAMALTNATGAVVEIADGDAMVYRAVAGAAMPFLGLRSKRKGGLSGLCVATGEILRCDDSEADPRADRTTCRRVGARSMLIVPLINRGTTVGVLKVFSSRIAQFGELDLEVLRLLAGFIASAIAHAAAYEAAAHSAMHDALTGIANRALLLDRLGHELAATGRSRKAVGVVFIDLDGFKQVNDRHGHRGGDAVLIEVARRLERLMRAGDTVARLGGDEFVVVTPNLEAPAALDAIVDRIRGAVSRSIVCEGQRLRVGASIGTCFANDPEAHPEALLALADGAMYAEKVGRRGERVEPRGELGKGPRTAA
jgi:diguanylate cyclase (GGDEF)-like protein